MLSKSQRQNYIKSSKMELYKIKASILKDEWLIRANKTKVSIKKTKMTMFLTPGVKY